MCLWTEILSRCPFYKKKVFVFFFFLFCSDERCPFWVRALTPNGSRKLNIFACATARRPLLRADCTNSGVQSALRLGVSQKFTAQAAPKDGMLSIQEADTCYPLGVSTLYSIRLKCRYSFSVRYHQCVISNALQWETVGISSIFTSDSDFLYFPKWQTEIRRKHTISNQRWRMCT